MDKNFYSNPIKLIWMARSNLLPPYLIVIWFLIVISLLTGNIFFDVVSFEKFDISNYFSASTTGLTFTLAIFTAERNVFKIDELKILAEHQGENDKYQGKALLELLGPFVFTSLIFLICGVIALIAPYIDIKISKFLTNILCQAYLDLLILGLFSLFNLVVTMLNDVYHAVKREKKK
ncbi:hypothetical protein [Vagococcus carniphilus]|uniref:Uncharacterized protein n=1 Tax=Vagococcus carniphilus TaxID=218144 RepID=A0A430AXH5_9ENTE|nr:hypothetical protein [Vagococcus carniphilus]QNN73910.1 hypothetical protein H9L18_04805 [Vagococcus carniphilus]RSU12771.1 hypothetical protein CBF28_10620 [Vagococcus carniphilus]